MSEILNIRQAEGLTPGGLCLEIVLSVKTEKYRTGLLHLLPLIERCEYHHIVVRLYDGLTEYVDGLDSTTKVLILHTLQVCG